MEFVAPSAADLDRHRRKGEEKRSAPSSLKIMEACVPGKKTNQNQINHKRWRRRATGGVSMIYSSYCVLPIYQR